MNFNIEFATFVDGGMFWDRFNTDKEEIETKFNSRTLADAGLGLRLKTDIFEKDLYLRIDLPFFLIYENGGSKVEEKNWIISFQRSI